MHSPGVIVFSQEEFSSRAAEEFFQPSVAVAVLERSRPNAELFHVVPESGYSAGMLLRCVPEIRDGFLHLAKRDEVAQFLQPREEPDRLAAIFRDVRAEQLLRFESGGQEREVIHKRVADIGGRER